MQLGFKRDTELTPKYLMSDSYQNAEVFLFVSIFDFSPKFFCGEFWGKRIRYSLNVGCPSPTIEAKLLQFDLLLILRVHELGFLEKKLPKLREGRVNPSPRMTSHLLGTGGINPNWLMVNKHGDCKSQKWQRGTPFKWPFTPWLRNGGF